MAQHAYPELPSYIQEVPLLNHTSILVCLHVKIVSFIPVCEKVKSKHTVYFCVFHFAPYMYVNIFPFTVW